MPRIRSIRPNLWSNDEVADLSRDARLLLIGLISFADDGGRFVASPGAVAGYVYPHDELPHPTVKKWLNEIEKKAPSWVGFYRVDGRVYGAFHNWVGPGQTMQRISHPTASTLPPPPGEETLL